MSCFLSPLFSLSFILFSFSSFPSPPFLPLPVSCVPTVSFLPYHHSSFPLSFLSFVLPHSLFSPRQLFWELRGRWDLGRLYGLPGETDRGKEILNVTKTMEGKEIGGAPGPQRNEVGVGGGMGGRSKPGSNEELWAPWWSSPL